MHLKWELQTFKEIITFAHESSEEKQIILNYIMLKLQGGNGVNLLYLLLMNIKIKGGQILFKNYFTHFVCSL